MLRKPKGLTFRLISVIMAFFFMTSFVFPKMAMAYRSNDGGGDLVEFDFGKWAAGTAIGMVSSALGSALISGLGSAFSSNPNATFLGSFTDSLGLNGFMENSTSGLPDSVIRDMGITKFSQPTWFNSWGTNLVNSAAVGQVQSAIGAMGSYYGWDPRSTIFISSIAGGVVGGGLAPGHFGSSFGSGLGISQTLGSSISTLEGMGIGLVEGTVEGGILMASMRTEHGRGRIDPKMGILANLAGGLTTGALVGGLTGSAGDFGFSNIGDFNLSRAGQQALRVTLRSIPSSALSLGVQSITRGMDKQDAYMVKNAFSGAYHMVNVPTGYLVEKQIMPGLFGVGERQEIPIRNTDLVSPQIKQALDPNSKTPSVTTYNQSIPPGMTLETRIEDISKR